MSDPTPTPLTDAEAEALDACIAGGAVDHGMFPEQTRATVTRLLAAARVDERERSGAANADVLVLHAGIDHDGEQYYCLGCLESLGSAMGAEVRWAEHVVDETRASLARPTDTKAADQ